MLDFFRGFTFVVRGFKTILHPELKQYTLIPLLFNTLLLCVGLFLGGFYLKQFIVYTQTFLPSWLDWLSLLLWPIFGLIGLIICAYGFTFLGAILLSPFLGTLSEKTAAVLNAPPKENIRTVFADIKHSFKREWQKLTYTLPRTFLVLILFIIPVLQLAAPIIAVFYSAWLIAFQTIDFPFDNNQIDVHSMLHTLSTRKFLCLGFGFAVLFFASIPLVNFFVIPASVIAATMLSVEILQVHVSKAGSEQRYIS